MNLLVFPNPSVVELWKCLSHPLEEVKGLEAILKKERRIEVFDEFVGKIPDRTDFFGILACSETYFAPKYIEQLNRFLSMNYRTKDDCIKRILYQGVLYFLKCAIENVFQHADGFHSYKSDIHMNKHCLSRTLDTPDRARAILVAQSSREIMYFYMLDNGRGFSDTAGHSVNHNGFPLVPYVLGAGCQYASDGSGIGLTRVVNNCEKSMIMTMGQVWDIHNSHTASQLGAVEYVIEGVKGTLLCMQVDPARIVKQQKEFGRAFSSVNSDD